MIFEIVQIGPHAGRTPHGPSGLIRLGSDPFVPVAPTVAPGSHTRSPVESVVRAPGRGYGARDRSRDAKLVQ